MPDKTGAVRVITWIAVPEHVPQVGDGDGGGQGLPGVVDLVARGPVYGFLGLLGDGLEEPERVLGALPLLQHGERQHRGPALLAEPLPLVARLLVERVHPGPGLGLLLLDADERLEPPVGLCVLGDVS